jgi:hypothetical protein
VAVLGFAPLLDDDVGVVLEEGDYFLRGGNLLPLEDPPVCLVDHLVEDADRPRQLLGQDLAGKEVVHALALMVIEFRYGHKGILPNLAGIHEQFFVCFLADRILLGVEDGQDLLLDHPPMVAVQIAGSRGQLLAFGQPASDDPDPIGQKSRVGGMVDVSLHGSGIDADLTAGLDLCLFRIADDLPVDRLPGLFPQRLDVLLEDRLAGILPHLQAGEAAEGVRVLQMKGQLLVGELAILLQDGAAQHLFGGHPLPAGGGAGRAHQVPIDQIQHLGGGIE